MPNIDSLVNKVSNRIHSDVTPLIRRNETKFLLTSHGQSESMTASVTPEIHAISRNRRILISTRGILDEYFSYKKLRGSTLRHKCSEIQVIEVIGRC